MAHLKFDVAKMAKLDDEGRFDTMKPEVMWAALGEPAPGTIVEIGAGTGLFSQRFADMAPDATVYAADTVPAMVEWMREHRPGVAQGSIVPVVSSEASVPLADGVADLVVMLNVHHELADPAAIYAEAYRLLCPGGSLLVVDWAPIETPKGPPLEVRAPAEELVGFAERAGFAQATAHAGALPWHSLITAVKA